MSKTRRHWFYLPCGIIIISVLLTVWMLVRYTNHILNPFDKRKFSAISWRAAEKEKDRHVRAEMSRDLIDHYLKTGMQDSDIVLLLGQQDWTWHAGEYTPPLSHDVYEYDMGSAHMITGEYFKLRIYFNSRSQYEKAEITHD